MGDKIDPIRDLLNYHPDMLFVLDRSGRIVEAGASAFVFLGLMPNDIRGTSFANLLPPDRREEFLRFISRPRMLRMNRYPMVRHDGVEVTMELHVSKGSWAGEEAIYLTAIDLSERVRSEAQVEFYMEEMERITMKLRQTQQALDDQLQKAAKLHRKLMPAIPKMEGIVGAGCFDPASRIGGDFYGVVPLGDRVLAYLVDVSGHGLDGALISLFVRDWVAEYLSGRTPSQVDPLNLLEHISSRFLGEELLYDYFICLQIALFDRGKGTFCLVNAGNPVRPMLFTPEGGVALLDCVGTPVAGLGEEDITPVEVPFRSGSRLLLLTDGVVDQDSSGERFGVFRVKDLLEAHGAESPEEILRAIYSAFQTFLGDKPRRDDVTMLCFGAE